MAEWLKAHAWKACLPERVTRVRIPVSPLGKPQVINSDQGSPFTSDEYVAFVKGQGIQISMDGKGRAIDNVIVERFFRTIKYDKLYLESLETGADVQRACHEFIPYYNHKRDHSSIGNQPPMVFYKLAA